MQRGQAKVGDEKNPRPKLIRNIFGGSVGGPVVKDRAFFFYSYEGRRDAAEQSILQTVPTDTLRQGIVRYRNTSGTIVTLTQADILRLYPSTGGVNEAGLAILRGAPLPNTTEVGDGLNISGFRFNAPISTKLGAHIARSTSNSATGMRSSYAAITRTTCTERRRNSPPRRLQICGFTRRASSPDTTGRSAPIWSTTRA